MGTTHDQFPTDTTGLPKARASEVVELPTETGST
jgi:hypothetical protein